MIFTGQTIPPPPPPEPDTLEWNPNSKPIKRNQMKPTPNCGLDTVNQITQPDELDVALYLNQSQ